MLEYSAEMLTRFVAQFPEFGKVPDTFIGAHMRACIMQVSTETWGDLAEQGVFYLTAHRMALSPFGNAGRVNAAPGNDQRTTYLVHYNHLLRQVAIGFRVA